MVYAKNDKVKIRDGRIGVIENICYEMINSEETDNIYCYKINIDGISGYIVYPDEIVEKLWNDDSMGGYDNGKRKNYWICKWKV